MKPSDPRFLDDIHRVRNLLSGKWMLAVAVVLLDGPRHYMDILAAVRALDVPVGWTERSGILQEGVLTRTLQRMTADELLVREEDIGAFPPSVQYVLTPAARDALTAFVPLAQWADLHHDLLDNAKQRRL